MAARSPSSRASDVALAGKVAAITGGSAGIGRAIAAAFLAEGPAVALFARGRDKGEAALAAMGAGERGLFVAGDATEQRDVEGFVDAVVARFGRVEILVNNAGEQATSSRWCDCRTRRSTRR